MEHLRGRIDWSTNSIPLEGRKNRRTWEGEGKGGDEQRHGCYHYFWDQWGEEDRHRPGVKAGKGIER